MNVWTTSAANGKIDAHRVREKLETSRRPVHRKNHWKANTSHSERGAEPLGGRNGGNLQDLNEVERSFSGLKDVLENATHLPTDRTACRRITFTAFLAFLREQARKRN
jgi:hypothetical protein